VHYVVAITTAQAKESKLRRDWLDRQHKNERRRMMTLNREKERLNAVARKQADEAVRLEREKERLR